MNTSALRAIALSGMLTFGLPSCAAAADSFSFGVISHPATAAAGDFALRTAIEETDADNLAFVVANGIKAADGSCDDAAYQQRRALLDSAKNGLVVSLAASDWAGCKDETGKPASIGRLARLRDLFFPEQFSFGASRIPIVRQSATARFRTYVENARWEIGDVAFATIDLPANNNHYLVEAGRNSEFEDRLVANRNWLHQIFTHAKYRKLHAIVLFSDGDPLSVPTRARGRRDGFAETRRQIITLARKFPGRVLIVHGMESPVLDTPAVIQWHGKLGHMGIGPGWCRISVNPALPAVFAAECAVMGKHARHQ